MVKLARHYEGHRLKIFSAFQDLPNIIHEAMSKAEKLPLNVNNPESVHLHRAIRQLQATLLKVLPLLIDSMVPGTFRKSMLIRSGGLLIVLRTLQAPRSSAHFMDSRLKSS